MPEQEICEKCGQRKNIEAPKFSATYMEPKKLNSVGFQSWIEPAERVKHSKEQHQSSFLNLFENSDQKIQFLNHINFID